jgi:primosomal replication protein N''
MTSLSCTNDAAHSVHKDGFVRSVGDFISSLGLNPSSRTQSDAFGLDFVLEDPRHKRFGIGIECDAYNHPILDSAYAREIWRPKLLSLGIPQIYRVTSYGWYHQRNEEMERLKKALEQALGITLKMQPQKPSNHQRILGDNS